MSSIQTLGNLFDLDVSATTTATRFSLRNCSGITFVLTGATSGSITITEATAASGGTSQTLAGSYAYFTKNAGVWTAQAATTVNGTGGVAATTGGLLAIFIPQGALSDGFSYLAASHATGTFVAIMSELDVKRRPNNLQSVRL